MVIKMRKSIKDYLVSVFLIVMIVVRLCGDDNSVPWIGYISYLGLIIALGDLFYEIIAKYGETKRMGLFFVFCMVGATILVVGAGLIMTETITLSSKIVDILTPLTLFISLPHKLYIRIFGKLLKDR